SGGWNPRRVLLGNDAGRLDLEADEAPGAIGTGQRVLGRVAGREDRPCTIRAAPERPEHMPGLAVDADPADAVDVESRIEPGHAAELTRRRDEEADARAADARLRRDAVPRDLLAERGGDRELVEVHAQGGAAELRVMAAAESRRELADERALLRDEDLRVRRA